MPHPALLTVDAMIRAGRPFTEIEDTIDELDELDDLKASLWLLAWAELPAATRRALVLLDT